MNTCEEESLKFQFAIPVEGMYGRLLNIVRHVYVKRGLSVS